MNYIQLVSWTHGNASPWRCNRIWWVDTSFLCPMNGQLWDTFYMALQKMSITTVPCLKWATTLTAWEQTLELVFLLCLLPQPDSFYMGSFFKMLASPGSRLHFLGGTQAKAVFFKCLLSHSSRFKEFRHKYNKISCCHRVYIPGGI